MSVRRAFLLACKFAKVVSYRGYRSAFLKARVAAAVEHERLVSRLGCATVIDIGANRGQFALVSRRCFPTARIISFEPLSKPVERFRRIFCNDPLVVLHQVAIGEEPGETVIHVSAADDSSSLLPITSLQNSLFSGTFEVGTETIRVELLEAMISPGEIRSPALLKIDVQGYELKTLKGCTSLFGFFQYAYVECSFMELYEGQSLADDICAYMRQHGWRMDGIYNMQYDAIGRAIQADFFFLR